MKAKQNKRTEYQLKFIDAHLRLYGVIHRRDLELGLLVSKPQGTVILRRYLERVHEGTVYFRPGTHDYKMGSGFVPMFWELSLERYLRAVEETFGSSVMKCLRTVQRDCDKCGYVLVTCRLKYGSHAITVCPGCRAIVDIEVELAYENGGPAPLTPGGG